jgi:hypothetical protein
VDHLARADYLLREARYSDGAEAAKQHLLRHPEDAGGHFLLGRAFLTTNNLVLAQGEFETALHFFYKNGKQNPLPRFEDAEYFELICHIEMTKVFQKQFVFMLDMGVGKEALAERLTRWRASNAAAKAINPDRPELAQDDELIAMADALIKGMVGRPGNGNGPIVQPLEI